VVDPASAAEPDGYAHRNGNTHRYSDGYANCITLTNTDTLVVAE
jgi:hypothetical protein